MERMARDYLAIYRALSGVPAMPNEAPDHLLNALQPILRAAE